eukprot:COSAG05_NODE_183_length_14758_cov_90.142506_5_plen_344_part_00
MGSAKSTAVAAMEGSAAAAAAAAAAAGPSAAAAELQQGSVGALGTVEKREQKGSATILLPGTGHLAPAPELPGSDAAGQVEELVRAVVSSEETGGGSCTDSDAPGQQLWAAAASGDTTQAVSLVLSARKSGSIGRQLLEYVDPVTGRRAYHLACAAGDAELVQALVEAGCDTTARDHAGSHGGGATGWELGLFCINTCQTLEALARCHGDSSTSFGAQDERWPLLAAESRSLARIPHYHVEGAGSSIVNGVYKDDLSVARPGAGMLDFAPVPQLRQFLPHASRTTRGGESKSSVIVDESGPSTILIRRNGPHWWIVDAPSALDGRKTIEEELWDVGDETWYPS